MRSCAHLICSAAACRLKPPIAHETRRAKAPSRASRVRALCKKSFAAFVRHVWNVVEPTRALLPSVAVDGITFALQSAADDGGRWAISCPPGVSKSLLSSVLYPAWLLLKTEGRARVMCASYSWDLATRDSVRCRALIESPEYRALVGGAWSLSTDSNRKDDFSTTASGRRLVASIGGKALGERVGYLVVDDPLSGADVYSEAKRREAARWICEVLPTRLDDVENATQVIVGQRLHPLDPIGVILDQDPTTNYLALPAIATEDPCIFEDEDGVEVWRDPRAPGEPLFSLLSHEALAQLRRDLGSAAFSAQYQQEPHDEATSMFKRAWLTRRWTELPERFDRKVVTLDATFTESSSSDFAVIQVWGALKADRYLIEQWRKQAGFSDTLTALREVASRHPSAKILVEKAANGHAIIDQLRREIPAVVGVPPDGGKIARAASVQAIVESGVVLLPAIAPWVDAWIDEVCTFPGAKNDDQVDGLAYSLREMQARASSMLDVKW